MENCYRSKNIHVDYVTDECNEPTAMRSNILRSQKSLPDYVGETEPRAGPKPMEKHRKQNYPGFPEHRYDSINHEIPNGCESLFAAKYPYYDNQLHKENTNKKSTKFGRSTGTDCDVIQTYEEVEELYTEPTAYRTNRNSFNALNINSSSASSESESELSWNATNETYTKKSPKNMTSGTGEGIIRREMKPKSQTTSTPNVCFQEKLWDENWAERNISRNEALPDDKKRSGVRTEQDYKEFYDDPRDSISHGIPHSYGSSSSAYFPYDDQFSTGNTNIVTKFSSRTESDDDDRQTEEHTAYEEPKTYGRRRNAPNSSRVTFVSSNASQQCPSKETDLHTAFKNKSEKDIESWRIKREMELMNELSGSQNVCPQEELSYYSDDDQRYIRKTDHIVTRPAIISETGDDDRQRKQRRSYEEPKTYSRGRNCLISSGMALKPGDSGQQQMSRKMALDTDLRNQWTTREVRLRSRPDYDQNFCHQEETDYSDKNATRRKERFHEGRRIYWDGEASRNHHPFKEEEPNPTFSTKDNHVDPSEAIYFTKGKSTEYGHQNRGQTPKWKNEKAVEGLSSEAGAQRRGVSEQNQKSLLNPNLDYVRTREKSYQAREKEFDIDYGNQDRKSYVDRVSRCVPEESIETGPVEYKNEIQGREEFYSREKLYERRANDSYEESKNAVIEINQRCCSPDRYNDRRQQFQGTYYNRNLSGRCIPEFSCADNPHTRNDFYELAGSKGPTEKEQPCEDVPYRKQNLGGCDLQGYLPDENEDDSYARFLPNSNPSRLVKNSYWDDRREREQRYSERQPPCQDVPYRKKNLGGCDPQGYLPDEDGSYVRFLPNSNPQRLVKNSYLDGSNYYYYRKEHEQISGFTDGTSSSTSRNINQPNDKEGRSVSRSVSGTDSVYRDSRCYPSFRDADDEEEQAHFSLEQISNHSRSVHESNMSAVKDTVMADLSAFGTKLNEAIRASHASLQLFKVAYEEWLKTRNATLKMSTDLQAGIGGNGDWQSSFKGFCDFLKTAGKLAEQILKVTPYGNVAVPVVRVVPPVIEKLGYVLMGFPKENKKKDPKFLDMLQVLQADIEESSQLKLFALQCEMQFRETEELINEFCDALYSQQMANAVEDMGLLNFIIDLIDANPKSDSFFRHISDAYQKFYNTGREERSATWKAFCSFIDPDPSALETLQCINWQFTKFFQNSTAEKDLSACWSTISSLASSSNTKEAEDALNKIAVIIRILETQRNFVNANVSRLFKAS